MQLAEQKRIIVIAQQRIAILDIDDLNEAAEAFAKAEREVTRAKLILEERRKEILLEHTGEEGAQAQRGERWGQET